MRKRVAMSSVGEIWNTPAFLFLIVLFLCGVIIGGFTGVLGGRNGYAAGLAAYLENGLTGEGPTPWQLMGNVCSALLWILVCVIAGAISLHRLTLSLIVGLRGFVLSFAVAATVTELGVQGVWISAAATGVFAVVSVPCLLIAATAAFLAASSQGGGYLYALARYRSALALCAVLSMASAVLRVLLAPVLIGFLPFG